MLLSIHVRVVNASIDELMYQAPCTYQPRPPCLTLLEYVTMVKCRNQMVLLLYVTVGEGCAVLRRYTGMRPSSQASSGHSIRGHTQAKCSHP